MSVKSHDSNQSRLSIKNDLSQNFTARQHRLTRRAIANSFSKSANYIKIFIKTMDRADIVYQLESKMHLQVFPTVLFRPDDM